MQEQIIEQSICKHLEENKVIRNSLHGFVKNKSHQSDLISFFDRVTGPVDKEEEADVIDLDFSEAFDTHPHDIFISKQEKYCLDEVIMWWVQNWKIWLISKAVINGLLSDWENISNKIPQRTVLGPVLFNMFSFDDGICRKF